MTPVFVQIRYFLNTVAIGLIIGIVFDLYRAIRFYIRPRKWTADLLDVLISILLTVVAFILLLLSNWGEVRFYVFLGIGLGLGIYIKYFSARILSWWFNWFTFLVRSIMTSFKIIFLPFKLLAKLLAFPLGLISLLIYKLYKLIRSFVKKPVRKLTVKIKGLFKIFHKPKKP